MIDKLLLDDIAFAFEDRMSNWYIHKSTVEIIDLPEDDGNDNEDITADREMIDANVDDYLLIERVEPHVMFNLMEEFTEELNKPGLQEQLRIVLSGKKPFANFRNTLNYHPDYLKEWYAFKDGFMNREAVRWLKEHELYEKAMSQRKNEESE